MKFIDLWDNSIDNWKNTKFSLSSYPLDIFDDSKLSPFYVPEPYYCPLQSIESPGKIDFVILNLNPGRSDKKDFRKIHDLARNGKVNNDMFGYFNKTGCKYSVWQEEWSPLKIGQKDTVPGVKWWRQNRLNWLHRFTCDNVYSLQSEGHGYYPILAAELCPLHSLSWNSSIVQKILSSSQYKDDYLYPVLTLIPKTAKQYGLSFGKSNYDVLCDLGFEEVFYAYPANNKLQTNIKPLNGWPKKNGNLVQRAYSFLRKDIKGKKVYVLAMFAQGTFCAPSKDFAHVEDIIKDEIDTILKTGAPSQSLSKTTEVLPHIPMQVTEGEPANDDTYKLSVQIAEVVQEHIDLNAGITFDELQEAFPKSIISPALRSKVRMIEDQPHSAICKSYPSIVVHTENGEEWYVISNSDTWKDHLDDLKAYARKHKEIFTPDEIDRIDSL